MGQRLLMWLGIEPNHVVLIAETSDGLHSVLTYTTKCFVQGFCGVPTRLFVGDAVGLVGTFVLSCCAQMNGPCLEVESKSQSDGFFATVVVLLNTFAEIEGGGERVFPKLVDFGGRDTGPRVGFVHAVGIDAKVHAGLTMIKIRDFGGTGPPDEFLHVLGGIGTTAIVIGKSETCIGTIGGGRDVFGCDGLEPEKQE